MGYPQGDTGGSVAAGAADETEVVAEHVVQFYDRDDELQDSVSRYLGDGLRTGEGAIVIATPDHRKDFEAALVAAGVNVDAARQDGRFVSLDATETMSQFVQGGVVDAERFASVIGPVIQDAAGCGRGVRAYGEMVAVLWAAGQVPAAIELEELWNDLGRRLTFSLLCAYPSEAVLGSEHAAALRQVCHCHSAVLGQKVSCDDNAAMLGAQASLREVAAVWSEERRFSPRPDSPRQARRYVVEALRSRGCSPTVVDDAALVLTELASNAFRHAASSFTVGVATRSGALRVSVRDSSLEFPTLREAPSVAESGRGLRLVRALSSRWGAHSTADGKVVWADLPMSAGPHC